MSLRTKFPRVSLNDNQEYMSIKTTFPDVFLNDIWNMHLFRDKVSKDTDTLGIYVLETNYPRSQLNDFWDVLSFIKIKRNSLRVP